MALRWQPGRGVLTPAIRLVRLAARPGIAFAVSALIGFGARATETAAKFLLQLTIARTLGPVGSGDIFLALSIANLACTMGRIGLDRALTFRIATAMAQGQDDSVQSLVGTGLTLCLVLSGALAVGVAAASGLLAQRVFHDPGFAAPLRIMAVSIVPLALLAMVVGVLNGVHRPSSAQLIGSALWPALAALLALIVRDLRSTVLVLLASIVIACLAGLLMLWQRGLLPRPALRRGAITSLTEIGWPLFVVDTVQITLISLPTLVLGMYRGAGEVGVFALANRISLILTVVLMVMAGLGSSRMASCHARGDQAGLQRVMRNLFVIATLASMPAVIALFVFAPDVLSLFGPSFTAGAAMLRWLLLGQVVGILFTCSPSILEMTGNGWRLRRVNLVALAVNTGFCFALIPPLGGLGAALATTFTLISYYVTCAIMAWRHLRIHASPLAMLVVSGRGRPETQR
jgi:O-antigen/teichoic acid export membrane protein